MLTRNPPGSTTYNFTDDAYITVNQPLPTPALTTVTMPSLTPTLTPINGYIVGSRQVLRDPTLATLVYMQTFFEAQKEMFLAEEDVYIYFYDSDTGLQGPIFIGLDDYYVFNLRCTQILCYYGGARTDIDVSPTHMRAWFEG